MSTPASHSGCGYNTGSIWSVSGVPALVPYGTVTKNEQLHRVQRLAALEAPAPLRAPV